MKATVLYLVIFSFVVLGGNSFAQLELKPAAGVNFSNFSKDPESGESSADVGWQLGGTISTGQKLYFEGGLFWVNKSTEFKETQRIIHSAHELGDIRVPVMVGLPFTWQRGRHIWSSRFWWGLCFHIN